MVLLLRSLILVVGWFWGLFVELLRLLCGFDCWFFGVVLWWFVCSIVRCLFTLLHCCWFGLICWVGLGWL